MKTLKILVYGKVQGVAYRYYSKQFADRLKLQGRVRNLSDGRVEIYVTGPQPLLDLFIKDLYKGSPYSEVKELDLKEVDFMDFKDFLIII